MAPTQDVSDLAFRQAVGMIEADPDQYGVNFRDYMNAKLPEQKPDDIEYLQKHFFDGIPEGWG